MNFVKNSNKRGQNVAGNMVIAFCVVIIILWPYKFVKNERKSMYAVMVFWPWFGKYRIRLKCEDYVA